jgi:hypothetical protein
MVRGAHLPVVPPSLETLCALHLPELEAAWSSWTLGLTMVLHLLVLVGQVEVAVGTVQVKGQVAIIYWGQRQRWAKVPFCPEGREQLQYGHLVSARCTAGPHHSI